LQSNLAENALVLVFPKRASPSRCGCNLRANWRKISGELSLHWESGWEKVDTIFPETVQFLPRPGGKERQTDSEALKLTPDASRQEHDSYGGGIAKPAGEEKIDQRHAGISYPHIPIEDYVSTSRRGAGVEGRSR